MPNIDLKPYSATTNGASPADRQLYGCGDWCVAGPGNGFGYYSWAHYPHRQFQTLEQAELVAKMCNDAYRAGVSAAQNEFRKALGL